MSTAPFEAAACPACFPRCPRIGEPMLNGVWWSERHLQCLWTDARLRPELFTTGGLPVEVLDAGMWNGSAGPDFHNAVIRIGGEPRKGDVEIHIHPGDWFAHGHETDPRYDRVILHVTWFPPRPHESQPEIPLVTLADATMAQHPHFSFDQIDPDTYPWNAHPDRDRPCRDALAGVPADDAGRWLETAGQARINRKTRELAERLQRAASPTQSFYAEIMATLGLRNNAAPMRALADAVPVAELSRHSSALERYALLLGSAGLLPREESATVPGDYLVALWNASFRAGALDVPEAARRWYLSGVRPPNHPRMRLATAAALFATEDGLYRALHAIPRSDPKAWTKEAIRILREAAQRAGEALPADHPPAAGAIGPDRIHAMLINAVVPFLSLEDADAWKLAAGIPGESLSASMREMAFRLFGGDHNPAIYAGSALRMQGLLEIWKGYCGASEHACATCRLASAAQDRATPQ